MAKQKIDVYEIVTERFLAELEKGTIPWHKPWITPGKNYSGAYSRSTGKPYSLLNQMILGTCGEWATFKQIQEAGGRVHKGEKSSVVVFWKFIESKDPKDIDPKTKQPKKIPMLRYYNVFHVKTQTTLQPKHHNSPTTLEDKKWADVEAADAAVRDYLSRSGVRLYDDAISDRAFYSPSKDSVTVPSRNQFPDPGEYYSTLFHELTHSTGHKSRFDRFSEAGSHAFGSDNYSKEELVAEIGAAALVHNFGMETKGTFKNSTAYIQSWSSKLREDKRMIVVASGKAEKAVKMILGIEDSAAATTDADADAA